MSTSQLLVTTSQSAGSPRYTLLMAQEQAEVRAAQRLRHRVFAGEMGAVLHSSRPGLDIDEFDAHCDHLVVREDRTGEIVGTYRMLPPDSARRAGGLYCETEFAIPGLVVLREALVETGRSCVHPDHRTGAVVSLVWAGIARYLLLTGYRWLVGCASVPLRTPGAPDGALAGGVWETVRACGSPRCWWPEYAVWWWMCNCCPRCPRTVPTAVRWRPMRRPPSPRRPCHWFR